MSDWTYSAPILFALSPPASTLTITMDAPDLQISVFN